MRNKSISVLQFGKFYPPDIGGIELFMYDLTEELSKYVKVNVLCSNSKLKSQVNDYGKYKVYKTASFGKAASTSIAPQMITWLKKLSKNYGIIHMHLPDPMANLAYFLVKPRTKLILHWHSDIIRQKRLLKLYEPLQDWLLKRADKIIATSPNYIEGSKYLSKYKEKCAVIPLGLNPERLKVNKNKIKEIKKTYEGKPIILSIGRLIYYKGYEYLIKAMKDIDAYLLIGGSGQLKNNLQKLIKKMGLGKKIFLLGRIEDKDLGSFYKACDIFCLPSIYKSEAFGLTQVEAMYYKKSIVSTNISGSGVSWVNQNKVTGIVVEPKSSSALAFAINKLLHDKNLIKKFGNNAKKGFEENFHIQIVVKKILNLYCSLLVNRKGSALDIGQVR